MIFVVGARRSGTNWVGRIVGAHPDVVALPNETYLFHSLAELTERFQHGSSGSWQLATIYVERPTLIDALARFCDAVLAPHLDRGTDPAGRLLERTPDHVRNLRLIGEVYTGAHVVHIIRDARDVARSLVSMGWGPTDLGAAAEEWASAVDAAHEARPHLRHYHEVRYEELFADPTRRVADLYRSLHLRVDDALLEAALVEAEVPYNHDPSMPALAVEKWRTALTRDQIATIEARAGATLRAAGYEPEGTGPRPPAPPNRPDRRAHLRAGWRRLRRRHSFPRAARRPAASSMQEGQRAVDAFLGALRSGDRATAASLLDDRAQLRVLRGSDRWEDRGPDAADRFLDELTADPVLQGAPLHSDVHPSSEAFTVVIAATVGRDVRQGTLVVYLDDGRITRATWHTSPPERSGRATG